MCGRTAFDEKKKQTEVPAWMRGFPNPLPLPGCRRHRRSIFTNSEAAAMRDFTQQEVSEYLSASQIGDLRTQNGAVDYLCEISNLRGYTTGLLAHGEVFYTPQGGTGDLHHLPGCFGKRGAEKGSGNSGCPMCRLYCRLPC